MSIRMKYSIALLSLGLILALLPFTGNRMLRGKPSQMAEKINNEKRFFTADQVARFIVSNDSMVRLIDVRPGAEYKKFTLPGAVNVPYKEILSKDLSAFLGRGDFKNILFSNGDTDASYAYVIALGLGYENVYLMRGGMNEWYNTVMNSSFPSGRITARENAVFESRLTARRLFNQMNSMPDSLKIKLLAARQLEIKKLDGGCE